MGDCPSCADDLIAFELEGLEIDHCTECRGTWLDSGELDLIASLAGADPGPLSAAVASARRGKRSTRHCPRCGARMRAIHIKSGPGVELDPCPCGHGLWFDRGELRTALEAFEGDEAGAVAAFLGAILRHEVTTDETADTEEAPRQPRGSEDTWDR